MNRERAGTVWGRCRSVGALSLALTSLVLLGADREETLQLSPGQWKQDLRFLAAELPKRHKSAFHTVSKERFESEVAALDAALPNLGSDEVYVGMLRITSLIGDGHTYLRVPRAFQRFPFVVQKFGSEYRVTRVAPGSERALGARLLRVEKTPVEQAEKAILPLTPQSETQFFARPLIGGYLTLSNVLHGLRIIPDAARAEYTFADDQGTPFSMSFAGIPPERFATIKWVLPSREPPLFRQKAGEKFWFTYLPEHATVYCNFRSYEGLHGNAARLLAFIDQNPVQKLVIDLRQNGGGDFNKGRKELIEPIRARKGINQKGRLFVIIGNSTFSAAMSNAVHFRKETAAMLVGEPIGEKPNSFQENDQVALPNSRLTLSYSTRYYQFVDGPENVVMPDQIAEMTWEAFKAGRDPALEWILSHHN